MELVLACSKKEEKRVTWSAVLNTIGQSSPASLVIVDPSGNPLHFHNIYHSYFIFLVFDYIILEDILNETNFLPSQIYIPFQYDAADIVGMLTILNDLYVKGGYLPVYESPYDSLATSSVLLVKMICPKPHDEAENTKDKDPRGRPLLTLSLAQLVRKMYNVELQPLTYAEKILEVFNPEMKRYARMIHQTIKGKYELDRLNALSYYAINSWSIMNPKWLHVMWFDADIEVFMLRFFPQFITAYRSLSGVQRADMFRYLVVYQFGGVYTDLDVICFQSIINMRKLSATPQTFDMWRERVANAYSLFPHHPMIANLYHSNLSTAPSVEPAVIWYSNGNTSAMGTDHKGRKNTNNLYIGEERTTVDRPDENMLFPIQYLQWWFMASSSKHSALLAVVEDIIFRINSMHMDITRPARHRNIRGRNQFTLWLTGKDM